MFDLTAHRAFLTKLLWPAIALGAVLYCRHYWDEAPGLSLFVEAARCMLDGQPLQACNPTYTYPPIFALVMMPLVPLPLVLQNLIWYLATIGAIIACIAMSGRLAQRLAADEWSNRDLAWLYGIGILLSVKFLFAAIGNQSYDALVAMLVLCGLIGLVDDRATWAGVNFAFAAALKATPLLFLPYMVLKRHYRAAAVMAFVLVIVSVLPDLLFTIGRKSVESNYLMAWLHQVAAPALTEKLDGNPHTFWYASNPNNNSLRGFIGAFITEGDPVRFKYVLYSTYAVFCAIVATLILRTGDHKAAVTIDGALLLISMLMLSPMTSQSHYVALILPIFAIASTWRTGDAVMRKVAAFFMIVNLLLTNATSKDLVGKTVTFWAKEYRLLVVDAVMFLFFFAVMVARLKSAKSEAAVPAALALPEPGAVKRQRGLS